jgi:hypothetical protein
VRALLFEAQAQGLSNLPHGTPWSGHGGSSGQTRRRPMPLDLKGHSKEKLEAEEKKGWLGRRAKHHPRIGP